MTSLPGFEARYRFLFNPIRYTSLGLAVCEAMLLGMPVVGIASTEMATAVENGVSGLCGHRHRQADRPHAAPAARPRPGQEAGRRGAGLRAQRRFTIDRFVADWNDAFSLVTG